MVFNSTAIASGYAGRDPQGGFAIEAFKVCVEIFVKKNESSSLFLRKKMKMSYVKVKKKAAEYKVEKTRMIM